MKDSADIRKVNLYKIRLRLWSGEWKTKQQVAAETGLSVATCNTLLNELAATGEAVSEKTRIHETGPGALHYRINEDFESILCVWFDRIDGCDVLTTKVLATTGAVKCQEQLSFRPLTPAILQEEVRRQFDQFPNITSITVGTPSIAENGIIRHCDIPELENFELVHVLSGQFGVPVCLENDMHFKVFGYSQKHQNESSVVTLANFPAHILPGTATVHGNTIIKGHNQFAGMVGFLPYEMSREELLDALRPSTCRDLVSKAITSLIAIQNPGTIVLTGSLLDESSPAWLWKDCLRWIPEEYMPELIFQKDMDTDYLERMYRKALELKGVF